MVDPRDSASFPKYRCQSLVPWYRMAKRIGLMVARHYGSFPICLSRASESPFVSAGAWLALTNARTDHCATSFAFHYLYLVSDVRTFS